MSDANSTPKRSLVKAITYRCVIIVLDFSVIYILTKRVDVSLGFMVISNIYTTGAYFVHERIWSKIKWGSNITEEQSAHT